MLVILLFAAWVLLLIILRRTKMHFFGFVAGSIGLFGFLMYIGTGVADKKLEYLVTYLVGVLGQVTGIYDSYPEYAMITVYHRAEAISFLVDYECSGFIETLVYLCLLIFYPVYGLKGKAIYSVLGTAYILAANVVRVFAICAIIKVWGTPMFFFSHTVFARLLFFIFMVVLYYYVFTRPHILKQKVGNLTYGKR